jgi:hypothetical protein
MSFDLAAQMDALAVAGKTIIDNAYAYPPDKLTTPAFVVGYPDPIDEITYRGGGWKALFPCWIVLAKGDAKSVRDKISGYLGSASVRAALTCALPGGVGDATVVDAKIEPFTIGAAEYIALRLSVEVLS